MREIKFRAWDKKKEIMLSVDTIEFMNGGIRFHDGTTTEGWVTVNKGFENEITPTIILMQYTGLKDKNGKEIYDGDIIQEGEKGQEIWDNGTIIVTPPKGKVIYKAPSFNAKTDIVGTVVNDRDNSYGELYLDEYDGQCWFRDVKVIGNIHENPELLEEEK